MFWGVSSGARPQVPWTVIVAVALAASFGFTKVEPLRGEQVVPLAER